MEAVRRLDDYLGDAPMPFRLWLRQIAQDRLLMLRRHHRGAGRRAVTREAAWPDESSLAFARQLVASGTSPSARLAASELAQRVQQAVAQLPEADREIVLLRNFEGLSNQEVAQLLDDSARDRQPALRPGPAAAAQAARGGGAGGTTMSQQLELGNGSMEALLGQVADEFTDRINRGEQPDVEDYARRYPEMAAILRQVLPALQVMGPGSASGRAQAGTGRCAKSWCPGAWATSA